MMKCSYKTNHETERIIEGIKSSVEDWREQVTKMERWVVEANETKDPDDAKDAIKHIESVKNTKRCFRNMGLLLKEDEEALEGTYENYLSSLEYDMKKILKKENKRK